MEQNIIKGNHQRFNLKEHQGPVYAACHAGQPYQFFTAGSDCRVILWDAMEEKAIRLVAKSPTTVISLEYIKDLNYLLVGQAEGGVHIIDLEEGTEVKYLKRHKGYIFDIKYISENKELILASGDGCISAWKVPEFEVLWLKHISTKKVRKIDYSPSRKELAFACGDGNIQFYSSEDFTFLRKKEDFDSSVNMVKYHPTEPSIFAGEKAAQLHQISLDGLESVEKVPAHYWAIYDIQFSPDGQLMATASRDKTVKIWDINPLKVLHRLEGNKVKAHTHSVNKLLWLSNTELISTGDDGTVRMWDIEGSFL